MADSSAADRKRKLQEIRAAKAKKVAADQAGGVSQEPKPINDRSINDDVETSTNTAEQPEISIKFRNYQPYDNSLKKKARTADAFGSNKKDNDDDVNATGKITAPRPPSPQIPPPSGADVIKLELEKYQNEEELNIMPKKPNWDLKSQIEGKLEKLQRRTQKAIVEILREKIANEVDIDE
mmetsp:Transcript_31790/g.53630  ORF Transcript_31790/g.53630 Transcript_31790/m.53630 type:complete len:180 (-) Transcript_31790:384-923(-)